MPIVSVIVPCYNEERTIRLLLNALYQQTYPRQDLEVVIADGLSHDRTLQEINQFRKEFPDMVVKVVDNHKRTIPSGLNQAIGAASGNTLIRLDAHSMPSSDYVSRCVQALDKGLGENVGGVWDIRPAGVGWVARSIAAAAAHPLAVGDAHYRFSGKARPVDTVPFGAFRRELVERLGGFDESLLTNEDYEFNVRVRLGGGIVYLDPEIRSVYFARANLLALARQYWRYGYWKARMLQRFPGSLRWRQAIPPLFLLCLAGLTVTAPWAATARFLLAGLLLVYASLLLIAAGGLAWKKRDWALLIGVPLSISAMHFSWGAAFLWSMLSSRLRTPVFQH
jgi:succinoglycan biosynthesis protein ExoA